MLGGEPEVDAGEDRSKWMYEKINREITGNGLIKKTLFSGHTDIYLHQIPNCIETLGNFAFRSLAW